MADHGDWRRGHSADGVLHPGKRAHGAGLPALCRVQGGGSAGGGEGEAETAAQVYRVRSRVCHGDGRGEVGRQCGYVYI